MLHYIAICCTSTVAILCVIHYLIRRGRKGELIDKIPGSYAWPVIGNVLEYMVPRDKLWDVFNRMNSKYYPINRSWAVHVPIVNILHPDDVQALLTKTNHIEKSQFYDFIHPWLGTGLLTSKGEKFHARKKIMMPGFHFKVLQQFVGVFIKQSEKLVQSLCPEGEEVIPDLVSLFHKYTLNSICEAAMSSTSEMDDNILDEYASSVSMMVDIVFYRLPRPWLWVDWMFQFFKKSREQVRVLEVLHGFSTNIINERKRYYEKTVGQPLKGLDSGLYGFDEKPVEERRHLAILDLLISAQKQGADINDEGIREEVDTLIFAGYDTIASAICFTLLLLAENKEIQDTARAEVDAIFEGKDRSTFSIKEIQSLAYLERCIKESLRLFPSVPVLARENFEDLQLKDYLVPAGTIFTVFIFNLHRDPNFWPNPEVFDPDRFLPNQVEGRHPFAYIPFSAGPRNCIGQKFAMLELKTIVATFLHNFYLEPIDSSREVKILTDIVLRSVNPIRIKLVRRSRDG